MANELTLPERVAILETRLEKVDSIDAKLDELIQLKSKWTGALWFVSIIVGSGLIGLATTIWNFVNRSHL